MTEGQNIKTDLPDYSYLARLSDAEYEKLKERLSDFVPFTFRLLLKEAMKMMMIMSQDYDNPLPEYKDALVKEILDDIIKDKSLPAKLRAQLKKEMKEEEAKEDDKD